MDGLKRCPKCLNLQPEVSVVPDGVVTIACERHGYEMTGATLEEAVKHWNHVVDLLHSQNGVH